MTAASSRRSRDEIQRLEAVCTTERSKLIVCTLVDTGHRLSELCDLRTRDILNQGGEHYLRVRRGEGGKGRLVPRPGSTGACAAP